MAENSRSSIEKVMEGEAEFSGHGKALGAKGHHDIADAELNKDDVLLGTHGDNAVVEPHEDGSPFEDITIGLSWDNKVVEHQGEEKQGFFDKIFKKAKKAAGAGVDLDLGCLYELKNGERGCLQPFGEMFGSLDEAPWISISGDERTGNTEGADEMITVRGDKWSEIERVLVYIYIYDGAPTWEFIKPEIEIDIPGDEDLKMTPRTMKSELTLLVVGKLENENGGIRLTNHSEYFPGHAEMDRAFGFGLQWEDGVKD